MLLGLQGSSIWSRKTRRARIPLAEGLNPASTAFFADTYWISECKCLAICSCAGTPQGRLAMGRQKPLTRIARHAAMPSPGGSTITAYHRRSAISSVDGPQP